MIEAMFYAFIVYYWTQVLLFDFEKAGPFLSRKYLFAWRSESPEGQTILRKRPVAFFDYFRRHFGLYTVSKDPDGTAVWTVKSEQLMLWQCPHCLGFWVALFVAFCSLLWHPQLEFFFFVWFASAGINSFLVRFHES